MEELKDNLEKKEITDLKIIEKRKEKFLSWFKEPSNLALFAVLAFAIIIRIYYFWLTKNQALWWDEACYTSLAKNLIFHYWDGTKEILGESMIRPILFPFILSILMRIGFNEIGIRFLFVLISTVSVAFLYFAVKEMYGKKTAVIASFIYSFLWIQLFYTDRILVHILAQALLFPSIYFFVKALREDFNFKYFGISLFLLSITTLIRYTKGLIFFAFGIIFLIFLIKKLKLFLNYKFWLSVILGISPLLIFFAINFVNTGNIFPALLGGSYLKPTEINGLPAPPFWQFLNYLPLYLGFEKGVNWIFASFFFFFILGFGKAILDLVIGYDSLITNKKMQNNLLLIFILLITLVFFIFYLKGGEDRYLFPASISIVTFSALGIVFIFDIIKRYNRIVALILLFVILILGAYGQFKIGDSLIKSKETSYSQQKEGFEWIKLNTPKESILLGSGIYPYAMYYAERKYIEIPSNYSDFIKIENSTDYLLVHGFTPQPTYLDSYLQNQKEWVINQVFFMDSKKTQPIFIIYQRA